MTPFRSLPACSLALFATVVWVGPAAADHYRGARATVTAQNPTTFTVTINVTAFTDGPGAAGDSTHLGFDTRGQYRPGIDWGDGSVEAYSSSVAFVNNSGPSGTARYRGTFTHTYPDATPRTITVAAGCCAGYTFNSNNTPVAGNPVFGTGTPSYMVGFTNTAQAFAAVPALPGRGLLALAALLAAAGLLFLWRPRLMLWRG